MSHVIQRRPLSIALRNFIEENVGWPTGIVIAPVNSDGDTYSRPYIVITPVHKGQFLGPMSDPFGMANIAYYIKAVGDQYDQVEWGSDKVRKVLLSRQANGTYEFPLLVENMTIMERRPATESPGPATEQGSIFEIDDHFIFSITT